jgi:phosphoribosylanthranilate isomerase
MTARPIIKVCGLRERIKEIASLPVDLVGFIFVNDSPRCVDALTDESLAAAEGRAIGVFRNATVTEIEDEVENFRLAGVQLHGDESRDFCRTLRQRNPELKIIKSLSIPKDFALTSEFASTEVDLLLLDSHNGGSGEKFDWEILNTLSVEVPFLLAGGIDIQSAPSLARLLKTHVKLVGFDLNSRFEVRPGLKDPALVSTFLEEINR